MKNFFSRGRNCSYKDIKALVSKSKLHVCHSSISPIKSVN